MVRLRVRVGAVDRVRVMLTFLKPVVLFMPEPWMRSGWKNTVSPGPISR